MCCETIDSTSTSNTESGDAENCQLTLSEEKNKSTQKKKWKPVTQLVIQQQPS